MDRASRLKTGSIEQAFSEVSDNKICGSTADQVERQQALANHPELLRLLELIAEENDQRGIPEEVGRHIIIGARIASLTIAKAEAIEEQGSAGQ